MANRYRRSVDRSQRTQETVGNTTKPFASALSAESSWFSRSATVHRHAASESS